MIATDVAVTFSCERVADVWPEIYPLFEKHWQEIGEYKDIPLDPDFETYKKIDEMGMIRVYTAREGATLIGYCVFFINPNLHYKNTKQALQDVMFIQKDKRGFGKKFMVWCDEQLMADGVDVIHRYMSKDNDFGVLLERIGYEFMALIYSRRTKICPQ
jgi:hypothetical protein